jgi:DNA-binding CsgD family transcriptional regulator
MRADASSKRARIVELAIAGYAPKQIATELQMHVATVRRHLTGARTEIATRRSERLEALADRALADCEQALGALREILGDAEAPPAARVAAAARLIDAALKLRTATDIEERLRALEEAVFHGRATPY